MTKAFSTSIIIRSTPQVLWAILTDAARWPDWNPTVTRVDGQVAPGAKITVYSKASPGRAFPLTVTEFVPEARMVWSGGMPLGLFKGERVYTLTGRADGTVAFAMREGFSGLMAPLITRSIPDLQPSFDEFAAALRRRAETSS